MGNLGFLRISSVIILFHSPTRSLGQSVPVGGAYIGCGQEMICANFIEPNVIFFHCRYDVLFGNPDGASFLNGGLDPGLKPSKFILKKTFKNRDYCPLEGTCVELGGTYGEEVCSLQADMQQYKQDYSSLWSYDNQGNVSGNAGIMFLLISRCQFCSFVENSWFCRLRSILINPHSDFQSGNLITRDENTIKKVLFTLTSHRNGLSLSAELTGSKRHNYPVSNLN